MGEVKAYFAALAAAHKTSGAALVCLCSSDKVYATQAIPAATALHAAGAHHIYLAGRPGEQEAALTAAGVNHFIFAGLVPPTEVPKFVGIMEVLVHLSLREGLPRALPQALAAAKPVIAYDCDGAREVCRG